MSKSLTQVQLADIKYIMINNENERGINMPEYMEDYIDTDYFWEESLSNYDENDKSEVFDNFD